MKYLFSVIIPTYNRADRLAFTLDSLINQTYKNFEVIVCDDGSTDDTSRLIENYKEKLHIKYLWEENWGGPARPRNNGINASEGDWLCFLDSDDWWLPEKLEATLPHLERNDFIYHDLKIFKSGELKNAKISREMADDVFLDLLINRNGICNSSVVVRREVVKGAGGFEEDKNLIAIEDYDLWLRIAQKTNRFFCIRKVLGVYYAGGNNISSNYLNRNRIELNVYKKYEHLIPKRLLPQALVNLNLSFAVNYVMANDIRYVKCLYVIFRNGSLKNKIWAVFNSFFGLIYIKRKVIKNGLDS